MQISVGVTEVNDVVTIVATLNLGGSFGFAVVADNGVKGAVVGDGEVVTVLVGVGDDTGDAVVLVGGRENGGEAFNDAEAAGAVGGAAEVIVGFKIGEVEIIGAFGGGDGGGTGDRGAIEVVSGVGGGGNRGEASEGLTKKRKYDSIQA